MERKVFWVLSFTTTCVGYFLTSSHHFNQHVIYIVYYFSYCYRNMTLHSWRKYTILCWTVTQFTAALSLKIAFKYIYKFTLQSKLNVKQFHGAGSQINPILHIKSRPPDSRTQNPSDLTIGAAGTIASFTFLATTVATFRN